MTTLELTAYLDKVEQQGVPGDMYLSIPMAAAALEVMPATVRAYIKKGMLVGLEVATNGERWPGVTIGSVLKLRRERLTHYSELQHGMTSVLLGLRDPIEYATIMAQFQLDWRNSRDRQLVAQVLGSISKQSQSQHGLLLSACVVLKDTGRPSKGFFDMSRDMGLLKGRSHEADEEFWLGQMKKIRQFWASQNN